MASNDLRWHIPFLGSFVLIKEYESLVDLKVRGKSKITDFEGDLSIIFLVYKYILEFKIAMSEIVGVQKGDGLDNLPIKLLFERVRRLACLEVEKK